MYFRLSPALARPMICGACVVVSSFLWIRSPTVNGPASRLWRRAFCVRLQSCRPAQQLRCRNPPKRGLHGQHSRAIRV